MVVKEVALMGSNNDLMARMLSDIPDDEKMDLLDEIKNMINTINKKTGLSIEMLIQLPIKYLHELFDWLNTFPYLSESWKELHFCNSCMGKDKCNKVDCIYIPSDFKDPRHIGNQIQAVRNVLKTKLSEEDFEVLLSEDVEQIIKAVEDPYNYRGK